jgi:thiol-disulfide isomerase/thioredoxin
MKLIITFSFLLCSLICYSQKNKKIKIKAGNWISELQLNENDVLPFKLLIKKDMSFIVQNAEEEIQLEKPVFKNDSIYLKFPYFNSELVFKVISKNQLKGYWVNYNKSADYKIPCTSFKSDEALFSQSRNVNTAFNAQGKWQVEFEPNTNSSYPAVGLFTQTEATNQITGTFLTETGDYRFLAGNCTTDSLFLSCFDGSHAFLFKAALVAEKLSGTFNSGKHWKSEWIASKNEQFELTSPEELTYLKENAEFEFSLTTLDNQPFSFPNEVYKNKVVIIQIMGTWCPNCLDETMYFKSLYETYHTDGLEIISVCYEAGKSLEDQIASITRFKNQSNADFNFIFGGTASKNKAANDFNMLNDIISFPTSIFIGRDGKVKLVHTGFNGPGTGTYYTDYVRKTNSLIEKLLAE